MTRISLQIIIESNICTHFEKMKVCVFILACFKKDNDCIIIDIPLNEISPQINAMLGLNESERFLMPCVTSIKPYKNPEISFVLRKGKILPNIFVKKAMMPKISNTSDSR